jgi:hypothetical protein
MQEQQTGLASDRDTNLVSQVEATRSLEMFLGQEYLGVTEQLFLVSLGKAREDREILLENSAPGDGRALSAQASAPAGFEEVEHHR